MNKKDLRELFTSDWFNDEDVDFEVFFDKIWRRTEEHAKQARIDELRNVIANLASGQNVLSNSQTIEVALNDCESRIKELIK